MAQPKRSKDRTVQLRATVLRPRRSKAHVFGLTHAGHRTSLGGRTGFDYPVVTEGAPTSSSNTILRSARTGRAVPMASSPLARMTTRKPLRGSEELIRQPCRLTSLLPRSILRVRGVEALTIMVAVRSISIAI